MRQDYFLIYIANSPAFYKINLLNRIAKRRSILVVFTHDHSENRNDDFYKGVREFEYVSIARYPFFLRVVIIARLLWTTSYERLIVNGWSEPEYWAAVLLGPRRKNGVVIESSRF